MAPLRLLLTAAVAGALAAPQPAVSSLHELALGARAGGVSPFSPAAAAAAVRRQKRLDAAVASASDALARGDFPRPFAPPQEALNVIVVGADGAPLVAPRRQAARPRLGANADADVCAFPSDTSTMSDSTAHRTYDTGNWGQCVGAGFQMCLLELGGYGGIPFGLCLPRSCGPDEFTNASSPVWVFIYDTVPYIIVAEALYNNQLPLLVTCGDHFIDPADWSDDAVTTVGVLSALAAAVVAATAYTAVCVTRAARGGSKTKQRGGKGGGKAGGRRSLADAWRDAVTGASLAVTLPALASCARRKPAPTHTGGAAAGVDTSPMDGVRALSAFLVVLGHALVFTNGGAGPGFANGADLTRRFGYASWQVFNSAEFSVDSFFVLSGALGAYLLVRHLKAALPHWGGAAPVAPGVTASLAAVPAGLRAAWSRITGGAGGRPHAVAKDEPLLAGDGEAGGPAVAVATTTNSIAADAATVGGVWAFMLSQRVLRILPAYLAMMALWMHVMQLTGSGPFWYRWDYITGDSCRGGDDPNSGSWLWSALFVNNFVPQVWSGGGAQVCAPWGWYLSTDMQLHAALLLPACLAWLAHRGLGYIAVLTAAVALTAAGLGISVDNGLMAFIDVGGLGAMLNLNGDQWDYYYVKPWTRAPPFLFGVLLGLALTDWADHQKHAAKVAAVAAGGSGEPAYASVAYTGEDGDDSDGDYDAPRPYRSAGQRAADAALAAAATVLPTKPAAAAESTDGDGGDKLAASPVPPPRAVDWVATGALVVILTLLGWLFYGQQPLYAGMTATPPYAAWSRAGALTFMGLSRPAWGAGLSALLYLACTHRAGGAVGGFLSLPLWAPLGRLSFGVYLLHPLVIGWLGLQAPGPMVWSVPWFVGFFVAVYTLTHAAAALLFVVVEAPCAAVQKAATASCGHALRCARLALRRRQGGDGGDGAAEA